MKRLIALLLAFAMVFGLAGCEKEEVEVLVGVAVPIIVAMMEEDPQDWEEYPEDWEDWEEYPGDWEEYPEETLPPEVSGEILQEPFSLESVPRFTDQAYVAVNGNVPYFQPEDMTTKGFEYYSPLDELGRCGVTVACVGLETMPTEDRGEIGSVKPTGWQSVKYANVDGRYLYNRCHLIGFQLTGENINRGNLITGTRYLNIEGMLPFENMVADFVQETGQHVMYRVTPVFAGQELVARGVLMEGWSVEDRGESICFCVYAYNVQPGIIIDYATGESRLAEE